MLRMLSNFETRREKLMHLILAGQPQLADKLASPRLAQLRQRVSIIARLKPLSREETKGYIDHRLGVAGCDLSRPLFTKRAQELIASQTAGIPRNINNVCFNALSLGCAGKRRTIDVDVVREVLDDLDLDPLRSEAATGTRRVEPKSPPVARRNPLWRPLGLVKWPLRFALAVMLATLASWSFIRINPHLAGADASVFRTRERVTSASSESTLRKSEVSEVASAYATALPQIPEFEIIRAVPGDTLYNISIKRLGKYDADILARIREENPWLSDPTQILVGQEIRIPTGQSGSQTNHGGQERVPATSSAESEKP